jgi:hypothetical protein
MIPIGGSHTSVGRVAYQKTSVRVAYHNTDEDLYSCRLFPMSVMKILRIYEEMNSQEITEMKRPIEIHSCC